MGRTRAKRLRGYGNAIVLPLATLFVSSVIDAFADAADALRIAPAVVDHVPEAIVAPIAPIIAEVVEEDAA